MWEQEPDNLAGAGGLSTGTQAQTRFSQIWYRRCDVPGMNVEHPVGRHLPSAGLLPPSLTALCGPSQGRQDGGPSRV